MTSSASRSIPDPASSGSAVSSNVAASSRLLTLIAVVVVIVGLYFGRQLLIPLALAVVFAFLLTPAVSLLERCHLGRVPSVLVVLILTFSLFGSLGWVVAGQLVDVADQFPGYRSNLHNKIQAFHVPNAKGLSKASNTVSELSNELSAASESAIDKKSAKTSGERPIPVQVAQPPANAPQYLRAILGPLAGIFETSAMVIVFALYMLIKREDLRNRVIRLAGQGQLSVVTQALDDGSRRLSRYLLLQFLVNTIYGLIFGAAVYWIGIPHALLWGVLAALLRFVPYIGAPIAAGFPMVMALAVFPGWHQAATIFGMFVVLELITTNAAEPWLYGSNTGISSLAILVATMFWVILWGPVGLILSTPLTVGLILMGRYVPQLSFLHVLLGDEPVLTPHAHYYQRLLALDQEEARDIAHAYLKDHALGTLYDAVLIPALALAEKDRHRNALEPAIATFVVQSTRELIEELEERFGRSESDEKPQILFDHHASHDEIDDETHDEKHKERFNERAENQSRLAGLRVSLIPVGDEADGLAAMMLGHLLALLGCTIHSLPIAPSENVLEHLTNNPPDAVIISAIPPFAAGQARSICKRLRRNQSDLKILVGLWNFEGGSAKAQDRLGSGCTDLLAVSLDQAISLLCGPDRHSAAQSRREQVVDSEGMSGEPEELDPEVTVTGP